MFGRYVTRGVQCTQEGGGGGCKAIHTRRAARDRPNRAVPPVLPAMGLPHLTRASLAAAEAAISPSALLDVALAAELADVAEESLHEERRLLGVGDPHDGAAVARRGVVAALREPVSDVEHLDRRTRGRQRASGGSMTVPHAPSQMPLPVPSSSPSQASSSSLSSSSCLYLPSSPQVLSPLGACNHNACPSAARGKKGKGGSMGPPYLFGLGSDKGSAARGGRGSCFQRPQRRRCLR